MAGRLAAAGDGLALVGAGERDHREYCCQSHEQSENSFAHHISWSRGTLANASAGACSLRGNGRATAAGDGVGLVGAGKGCYRKHRGQRHEHPKYGLAHHNSSSRGNLIKLLRW